jgi:hypothetical protein
MRRLGFMYKKPRSLPAQADEARQAAFIARYEALMTGLEANEMVVFSDAVHPEHQSRPAHGWFPKGQKTVCAVYVPLIWCLPSIFSWLDMFSIGAVGGCYGGWKWTCGSAGYC